MKIDMYHHWFCRKWTYQLAGATNPREVRSSLIFINFPKYLFQSTTNLYDFNKYKVVLIMISFSALVALNFYLLSFANKDL